MTDLNLIPLFKDALADFQRNKVRTLLTSLGIMIGVLSVVLLIALGLGLKNYIQQQFERLGSNLIIIFPGNVFNSDAGAGGNFGSGFAGGANFDEKDYLNLVKNSQADYVVPVYFKSSTVEANAIKRLGYVQGTTESMFTLMNIKPVSGRILTKKDDQSRAKIAVLGFTLAQQLFVDPNKAVGKTVKVNSLRFTVVGVAEKKGDREMDSSVIMPYRTTFAGLNPNKTFFTIYLGVNDKTKIELVKAKAKTVLLKRYKADDFSVTEQTEILSTVNQIFTIINSVLIAIASISLLVGGIGIMNIMFATVTERTKEIGIRRGLGATKKDILVQFLSESVILSAFGGIIGLILAALIVLMVRTAFPASINLISVLLAFFVSSAIGITFGVFPARRAANLTPLEAIRYE
ncbi:MAG: ABC transporter permease [Candidatus Beckwithbacteria bacterium]|nr:ABC transporter permease [Candidatus Beckwithbacteria bacterium]